MSAVPRVPLRSLGAFAHRPQPPPTGCIERSEEQVGPIALGVIAFAALGVAAERVASVWPADEPSRRGIGWRTVVLAAAAGAAAGALIARSSLPWWATGVHLLALALLVLLTATDWDQRRLPHVLLDPLIVLAVAFVPFNPAVTPLDALIGAGAAVAFLGTMGLVVRGGVALGDLYLIVPLGLLLGWPAIFGAVFIAAILAAVAGLALLATRRAGMKSYIPFGPFLVAGAVLTLLREERLLQAAAAVARAIIG